MLSSFGDTKHQSHTTPVAGEGRKAESYQLFPHSLTKAVVWTGLTLGGESSAVLLRAQKTEVGNLCEQHTCSQLLQLGRGDLGSNSDFIMY